ncbi:MAG: aldose 1-epimerase [Bacteroidetes bacterium]|nr:aldose 1-epimerase [Bacteroidota bacterium]
MSFEVFIDHSQSAPVIILKDLQNQTSAEIYALGGILNAFTISKSGKSSNLIAGFDSVDDAKLNLTNGFKSAKLSPFVCRMAAGKYQWNEDTFQIEKFFLEKHAIHGIVYDAVYQIQSTRADGNSASVELFYAYPGYEKGYPFPYLIQLLWKLEQGNKLTITTTITNANPSAIPISDGWHPYFTLGDSVDDYTLQFDSHQQVAFDTELLPTGELINDDRFTNGGSLKGVFLDNCFLLDASTHHPKCILSNQDLQLLIEPSINYPYMQFYTPDDRKKIAIENLSSAPDAFNNKMGLHILEPQETINFCTSYTAI